MNAIRSWFHERLPISEDDVRALTNEPVPYHLKRWWFALGGTPAYLFVVQIVTGILLAFYYEASTERAYESVRFITEEAAFGWYLRSVHKWAATLMIAALVLGSMGFAPVALAQNTTPPPAEETTTTTNGVLTGTGLSAGAAAGIIGGLVLIAAVGGSDGTSTTTTTTTTTTK